MVCCAHCVVWFFPGGIDRFNVIPCTSSSTLGGGLGNTTMKEAVFHQPEATQWASSVPLD